jgi:RHS repeat-associated protein
MLRSGFTHCLLRDFNSADYEILFAVGRMNKDISTMSRMTKFLMLLCLLVIGHGAFAQSTGTVTYVYTDPQGTPLAEADASGNITATFEYTPYGTYAPQGTSTPGPTPNGPGYTGHVNDPETNLVYMQARYYDPATGRFLSADPENVEEADVFNFNRYVYADANPIINLDPDGQDVSSTNPVSPPPPPPKPSPTNTPVRTLATITVTATRAVPILERIGIPTVSVTAGTVVIAVASLVMDNNGFHDLVHGGQVGCYGALTCDGSPNHYSKGKKITKPGVSGKDGAKDKPSWASGERPNIGESGSDFADRLIGSKYPGQPIDKRPGGEWSKIRKWGDRSFTDP